VSIQVLDGQFLTDRQALLQVAFAWCFRPYTPVAMPFCLIAPPNVGFKAIQEASIINLIQKNYAI